MTLNKETYNKSTECYTMQGPFANNGGQGQGNYVGIVVKPNTKEDGVYWDRSKKAYNNNKKIKVTSKPFHYISSDGYDIYVGKNNYQNDELTFKFAKGDDFWFHAKGMAGSHVILKTNGKNQEEIPDRAFEEAASLAAYYSKGQSQDKVEVDYVLKKEIKKPAAAKPGFVVYYTNYSLIASTDISKLVQCQ